MRLDKFLKVSGLIPRRSVADEACDAGRVLVNGRVAKSSTSVAVGDRIEFDLGRGRVDVVIEQVPAGSVPRAGQSSLYRAAPPSSQRDVAQTDEQTEGSP